VTGGKGREKAEKGKKGASFVIPIKWYDHIYVRFKEGELADAPTREERTSVTG